jgi:hypothetical protein
MGDRLYAASEDGDNPMEGFMVGLSTGKDVPVSPLHIFILSVHSKTN